MEIRPAEISEILKSQIANFDTESNVAETGQVLSVGDGIARIFGLDQCAWRASWSNSPAPASRAWR